MNSNYIREIEAWLFDYWNSLVNLVPRYHSLGPFSPLRWKIWVSDYNLVEQDLNIESANFKSATQYTQKRFVINVN